MGSAAASGKKIILPIIAFLIIVTLCLGGYFLYKKSLLSMGRETTQQKVAKLIELNGASAEKVSTVKSVPKLGNDKFYARAKAGDILLIYPSANKAILFRPSSNKLVEVAYYDPSKASLKPSATPKKVRLAIYNGTKTEGLAKTQAASISAKYTNTVVNDTENASGDYTQTVVVDITGGNSDFVKMIARDLGGVVKSLPSVEARPEADILIILGEK